MAYKPDVGTIEGHLIELPHYASGVLNDSSVSGDTVADALDSLSGSISNYTLQDAYDADTAANPQIETLAGTSFVIRTPDNDTSNASAIYIGGSGATTTGSAGASLNLAAGDTTHATGVGGQINIQAGFANGSGQGGSVQLTAGNSLTGEGGHIILETAGGGGGGAGDIFLQTGDGAGTGQFSVTASPMTFQILNTTDDIKWTNGTESVDYNLEAATYRLSSVGAYAFTIDMPIYVTQSVSRTSYFGPTSANLSSTDSLDRLFIVQSAVNGFGANAISAVLDIGAGVSGGSSGQAARNQIFNGGDSSITGQFIVTRSNFRVFMTASGQTTSYSAGFMSFFTYQAGTAGHTTTTHVGFEAADGALRTSTTVTNHIGFIHRNVTGANGTITNFVGAYFETPTKGTTVNLSIGIAGAGPIGFNYVAGTQPTEFIQASAASTLDLSANTTLNFRVANAVEATITANNLTFNNGVTDTGFNWSASGVLGIFVGATTEITVLANTMTFENGATDTSLFWGTSGTLEFFVGSTSEFQLTADNLTFNNGATDTGLQWTTTGVLDFTVAAAIEMSLAANQLTFNNGATDTAIGWGTSGRLDLIVGAVNLAEITATTVVFNEASNDVDFRIESNNDANNFFSDGGSDFIGIGTGTPGFKLDVNGNVNTPGTSGNTYRWNAASTAPGTTLTPTFTSYYGGNTNALGDPTGWVLVNIAGTDRKIPFYAV